MPSLFLANGAVLAWAITGVSSILTVGFAGIAANRHKAYRSVEDVQRSLRDLHENISEGVFRSTLDGRMISANPALVRLNGFSSQAEMLREVNDIAGRWYVEPGRRETINRMLVEQGRVSGVVSEVFRYKTRERIWIEESLRLVRDPSSGRPRYYEGTVREVTETVRRLQLQERFEKIASVTAGCLYQMRSRPDGTTCMPYASVGLLRIYGIDPSEVEDDTAAIDELVHPDDLEKLSKSFDESAANLSMRRLEYRIRSRDGVEKWVSGHSVPEREAAGTILWHGYVEDVTERKLAEERIFRLAYRDPLTGLPNRAALLERLRETLAASERSGTSGALLFVDLDQFKILNDTKGHHAGDALLVDVAQRLEAVTGTKGTVARLGGDEFVILLADVGTGDTGTADVSALADAIVVSLARPYFIDGATFHTTASVGVSYFDGTIGDASEHLKRADLAMYEAKAAGRGLVSVFAPEMQAVLDDRLALTNELHEALAQGRLVFVCQPQVNGNGDVLGVEMLMRWRDSTRGEVSPSEFIPLAERAGLSSLLDAYVLQRACAMLARWARNPAMRDLGVAANISTRRLHRDFVRDLAAMIDEAGVDARRLTLEVTEHVMLDRSDQVATTMRDLKSLGVRIALDDFGTGYSSLTTLKQLPIDILKIDLSFVKGIEFDSSDRVIVQTILNIARSLDMEAIAEGVETEMQAILLTQMGCRVFQGYLFGRPMAPEALENWVERQQAGVIAARKLA